MAAKTERDYRVCAKALCQFFGKLTIGQIHEGHLMAYQEARAVNERDPHGRWRCVSGNRVHGPWQSKDEAQAWAKEHGDAWQLVQTLWARRAGANCIRKEIALMIRVLKSARLWGDEQEQNFLRLRPEESDVVRAMTIDEQHRFLHVASSRQEFRFIYQYAIVALQTTAGTNEMRALRLGDVFLDERVIQVPRAGAKNKYRMRAIPLVTDDAAWAMEGLIMRARDLGASSPADYLFPIQSRRGEYDAARPMSESGLKKPWDAVRRAAGLPSLRIYDLRHTGITRMAEAGVPLRVAMTFAGHMTEKMQRRYEAICMAAKREWGAAVWGSGMESAAMREAAQAAAGRPSMRKPVASERGLPNQEKQHFHTPK